MAAPPSTISSWSLPPFVSKHSAAWTSKGMGLGRLTDNEGGVKEEEQGQKVGEVGPPGRGVVVDSRIR